MAQPRDTSLPICPEHPGSSARADAEDLLGAPESLLSDAVLGKANVSLDLVHATAL